MAQHFGLLGVQAVEPGHNKRKAEPSELEVAADGGSSAPKRAKTGLTSLIIWQCRCRSVHGASMTRLMRELRA